ncbi:retrovirus-related pol polyprotein from transposon TNT 1-94 [Tanacetum coccineum]
MVVTANLSNYGSDVILKVPYHEPYHTDMDNQSVHTMQGFEQTLVVDFIDDEITSDSNIISYSQYLQEMQQATVQDTNLYAQQDSMILSVIEKMSEQMINQKESKYMDKEIGLEKKIKELDNIVYKVGQSAQTKAQWIKPTLYDGSVISSQHVACLVIDDEETLILEEAPKELPKTLKDIFNVFDKDLLNEITEVQTVFNQMEAAVQQYFVDKQCFEIHKKELFLENDRLLQKIMSQDVMIRVMNSIAAFDDVNVEMQSSESCVKCLNLDAELLNKHNEYNDLSKSCSQLEKHCISLELTMQLNQEIFQKESFTNNQNALEIPKYFENNDLKAQLQAKDTTICKLKEHIKMMRENDKEEKVKHEMEEIETINIELEHRLKCSTSTCRSQPTGNKNNDRISQKPSSNRKNKVEAQPRKMNKKNRVKEPICDDNVKHTMLNANSQLIYVKCKQCMFDANNDVCFLDFVNDVNMHAKYKSKSKKSQVKNIWKPTGKVFTDVGLKWKPTARLFTIVGNSFPLTRFNPNKIVPLKETTYNSVETPRPKIKVYSRRPKQIKSVGSSKKAKLVESKIVNNSEPNHLWGSNATDVPSSSSLVNDRNCSIQKRPSCKDNEGHGDYQLGNIIISRVYYVEGLGHNFFSVEQFCDVDLEVAFQKNTCYILNLEGVDLLSGSKDTNLYTISLDDMLNTSPICLLSKASKNKSWLWHRRLSHLNFGKSKKSSHQPKAEDTNQEKLYLLHMDHCGPMHVESINGKKYILVIVDDYSRFTWVKILRSKDEAPDAIIKCIKNIQVPLNATVRNVRTDIGTEFVNQTLHDFYENVGISHQTYFARTPQ